MNRKLKAKIIERYGSQAEFSYDLRTHAAVISRIVRGRREISLEQKELWASKLDCKQEEIFSE